MVEGTIPLQFDRKRRLPPDATGMDTNGVNGTIQQASPPTTDSYIKRSPI